VSALTAVATATSGAGGARAGQATPALRRGTAADAPSIHSLVGANLVEGHLLPRTIDEIVVHAPRFLVAECAGRVVACAELAPMDPHTAEVRSLVVDREARGGGLGRRLVRALRRRARIDGYTRLCAFTHEPGYFVRMGFSVVPHAVFPEKIATDCHHCPLFRSCGQHAVVLAIHGKAKTAR
jgi:amino-acid N-acetyltransferase